MARKNKHYRYLIYSSIGFEVAASIIISSFLGLCADMYWNTKPYLFFLGFFIGIAAAVRVLIRLVKETQEDMEEEDKRNRK